MRQAIDEVRAEDSDAPFVIQALDMYGGIGLFTEQDYPINRDNIGFEYHDHWWSTSRPTTKESMRARQQERGGTWCLQNNRAVFCGDFNYDANLGVADDGGTGQLWLINFLEVMEEDGFAGWAHWTWLPPNMVGSKDWAEITAFGTGNPTTQGQTIQPFLNLNARVTPEQQPSRIPFEDGFEGGGFSKWNKTGVSSSASETFGKTTVGGSYDPNTDNDIIGGTFNSSSGGSASSIAWYGRGTGSTIGYVKCAIYYGNNTLLSETERLSIGSTTQWYTHDFPSSPSILASTEYKIVVWFDADTARIYYDSIGVATGVKQLDVGVPNGFPDPLVPDTKYRNFSVYVNLNVTGGASLEISSTAYAGSYSANFTTATDDNAYVYAEVYFTDTYEYLHLRSYVYFDTLPDSGDGLSIMQFLNSSDDWIGDVQYIREANGTYGWKVIIYNIGGNLEYEAYQTISVQTWQNVEFYLNISGTVQLWINETEKISQTGDYNDSGQIKKTQIRIENVGTQGANRIVLHDYIRIDDERIYSETSILFFSSYSVEADGEIATLASVEINGSATSANGLYSWANLAYNQIYTFNIKKPASYYPAWVTGADSLTWNGTHFIVTYNLTDTNHYIQPVFHEVSRTHIDEMPSGMTLVNVEVNIDTLFGDEYNFGVTGSSWILINSSGYNEEPFLSGGNVTSKTYNSTTNLCNITIAETTSLTLLFNRPATNWWDSWWNPWYGPAITGGLLVGGAVAVKLKNNNKKEKKKEKGEPKVEKEEETEEEEPEEKGEPPRRRSPWWSEWWHGG